MYFRVDWCCVTSNDSLCDYFTSLDRAISLVDPFQSAERSFAWSIARQLHDPKSQAFVSYEAP